MMTAKTEIECPRNGANKYAEVSRYTHCLALCESSMAEDCA